MRKLEGRVALVTGGARGIGASIARTFVSEGAGVVITDVLDDEGKLLAEELGPLSRYVRLDVVDPAQWDEALRLAERDFGPVGILVNNAGIVEFGGVADQDLESFRRVLDVNLVGPWLGIHLGAPQLRRAGAGVGVNISSTAGLMGYANLGAYVASTWGLSGLTKTAAVDLARDDIRVCSIHPGPIRTPMTADVDDSLAAQQPIPRFGRPEEVASMALFVVADATYSTGTSSSSTAAPPWVRWPWPPRSEPSMRASFAAVEVSGLRKEHGPYLPWTA